MAKKVKARFNTFKIAIIILFTILGYIAAFALRNYTMANFTIVLCGCAVAGTLAVLPTAPLAGRLTGLTNNPANILISAIVITGIFCGLFMTCNFAFSSESSRHEEKAVVIRKYKEKHYRSKRVARNRYVRGEPYYEYYISLEYGNGRTKPMLVKIERYNRIRTGDTISVPIERGLFGLSVIKH